MYLYYHFCRGNCRLVLESTINIFVHRKEETPCVLAMGLLNPQMCLAWRTNHQRTSLKRAASQVGGIGFTSCGHRIRTGNSEGQESKVLCNMKGANWWETSWFCCPKGVIQRFANICFHYLNCQWTWWTMMPGGWSTWEPVDCLVHPLDYLELKMKMTWWFLVGLGWWIMTCEVELMKVLVEKGKQVVFRWWSATGLLVLRPS